MLRTYMLIGSLALCLAAALALPACAEPELVSAPGSNGMLLGPGPVPKVIQDGRIKTDSTKLDIGEPKNVFDGNADTIIRTPSINPAFFEFAAEEPITFNGIRIITNGQQHEYTLAAANSMEDLRNKSGSYRVLAKGTTDHSGDVVYVPKKPETFSAFRVDLHRIEGDDYVHMTDWEWLVPVSIKDIKVDYKIRMQHAGEKAVWNTLDDNSTRPVNSLFIPRVFATDSNGHTYDVTDTAKINYTSKYARPWRDTSSLELTKPETVGVKIRVGDLITQGKVTVTPRTLANKNMDLDAQYVERLPRINFDGPNGGWPYEGQQVTWRAHVQNWGGKTVTSSYKWTLDGVTVATGNVTISAGQIVTVDLPWKWEKRRHYISFEVNPDHKIDEFVKHNNKVEFATDALAVGFYIEQSFADIHHDNQYKLGLDDANSFADYGQREMRHWNKMLGAARFPETPRGMLDRVRLDEVVIVPDQSLPFQGGDYPTNSPNLDDKTIDLMWGFPYKFDHFEKPFDFDAIKKGIANQDLMVHWFFLDLPLIHELNHARYLVDSYGFDVGTASSKDPDKMSIKIKDDAGNYIVGKYLKDGGVVHYDHYEGDMDSLYPEYGPYEAVMYNRVAGQRAQGGNTNGTSNIGTYLQDIPKSYKIRFTGPNGEVLANDLVKVYWATGGDGWYVKNYDNTPDREFTTDSTGCITTDAKFFSKSGKITHTWGWSDAVPIVRIDHANKTYYIFIEVSEINVLANTSKDPEPVLTETVPLRTGDPTPLPADYDRRKAPDWHLRTQFDRVDG